MNNQTFHAAHHTIPQTLDSSFASFASVRTSCKAQEYGIHFKPKERDGTEQPQLVHVAFNYLT